MLNIAFDTRSFEAVVRKIERFQHDAPEIAAREAVRQVREFTASGREPDGTAFTPYTPRYAAWRKSKGLQTRPVNLRVTTGMVSSVKNRGEDGKPFVTVDDAHQKIAEGLSKKRPFLEASPLTTQNVERLLKQEWDAS